MYVGHKPATHLLQLLWYYSVIVRQQRTTTLSHLVGNSWLYIGTLRICARAISLLLLSAYSPACHVTPLSTG